MAAPVRRSILNAPTRPRSQGSRDASYPHCRRPGARRAHTIT